MNGIPENVPRIEKGTYMELIHGDILHQALDKSYRVYLCGDLKKPQELEWIYDAKNEIGISFYKKFTADHPHFHTNATEYNYIISGSSKILLIDEQKEITLEAGSIFVIPPLTRYASKHQAGTQILFFKSPGGNDKELVDATESLQMWLQSW